MGQVNLNATELKTSPGTTIEDYNRLMHLADCENFLPKENKTVIKLN